MTTPGFSSRSRRELLGGGLALGACMALPQAAGAAVRGDGAAFDLSPAYHAVARILAQHRGQIAFEPLPRSGPGDRFAISGAPGRIVIGGTSPATLLTGLRWYLKYVADAQMSWAGSQLRLPARLPAPQEPIARQTRLPWRFALNDTDDGYSGPYRDWSDWERRIDVLALHGCNAVLVTVGQEAVYHRLLQQFGYSDAEARAWMPAPAHQPWWWLQNMFGFGGPVSRQLLERRLALGRRIVARLRELGIAPVFPGYAGTVPVDFARRNPGARTIPQGDWCGFQRPDWLDPTTPAFARVAAAFYHHQRTLFGDAPMYKMDLLHEGGRADGLDVSAAAGAVQAALEAAHPGAIWAVLGWLKNPTRALLDGVDRDRLLVLDGVSDRYDPPPDRERDWNGAPYAFGSIDNFGGHTTTGAKTDAWERRFFAWRDKPGSRLAGTAYMPEGSGHDAAALDHFSELAWREAPIVDPDAWFARYARARYGGKDAHAEAAWRALGASVYRLRTNKFSEAPDSLFAARPALDVATAATWSPTSLPYDPTLVDQALGHLLAVAPRLHGSDAWNYDIVDIGRQCLANRARALLPRLHDAFDKRDRAEVTRLSARWLGWMDLSERLLASHRAFLLGPWLAQARAWAADEAERAQLEYDARSILTTWGPRAAADDGSLHDYANREWSGLMGSLYRQRWQLFFASLDAALRVGGAPEPIDWFALEDAWAHARDSYPVTPRGSPEALAREVLSALAVDAA